MLKQRQHQVSCSLLLWTTCLTLRRHKWTQLWYNGTDLGVEPLLISFSHRESLPWESSVHDDSLEERALVNSGAEDTHITLLGWKERIGGKCKGQEHSKEGASMVTNRSSGVQGNKLQRLCPAVLKNVNPYQLLQ